MQKVVQGQIVAIEPRANGWAAVHIQVPGKQYPAKLSTKREDLLGAAQSMAWQMVDALYNEEESTNINPHSGNPYVNRYLEQLAPAGTIPAPQPMMQPQQQQQPVAVPTTGLQPQQQPQQFGNLQPQQMMPPQPQQAFPPQPQAGPVAQTGILRHEVVTDDARENRIMRQAATKVAAAFLPSLAEEDQNLGSLIRISEQLLKYYREGVSWTTNPPEMGGDPVTNPGPYGGQQPEEYAANPGHHDPQDGYENTPPPPGDEDIPF